MNFDTSTKNRKKRRIVPMAGDDNYLMYGNPVYEHEDMVDEKNNITVVEKMQKAGKKSTYTAEAINLISNVRQGVSLWKEYTSEKRQNQKVTSTGSGVDRRETGGIGLSEVDDDFSLTDKDTQHQMLVASNRTLLQYFARLGNSYDCTEKLDLDFVYSLFKNGAKVDCCDKYGQTIFHEVARAWHTDVAKFLIDNGADVNVADIYGRTPLHVAAAVDYPEMCKFLIDNNANKEAKTKGESQTPVHFASRNDACLSLKILIKLGCEYKTVVDYKNRTPIHVAAELDRSETARMLLENGAPACGIDSSGQRAIVWMITKMAPVAKDALNQFHITDRANRKQYFFLNKLVDEDKGDALSESAAQSPLKVCVSKKSFELITHPVINQLLKRKWYQFGRIGAWYNLIHNIIFILLWTLLGTLEDWQIKHRYVFPLDIWRIVLLVLAVLLTLQQVVMEIVEYRKSKNSHDKWEKWRLKEIAKDEQYCHPQWPEELQFLQLEKKDIDKLKPQYFNDFWNIFDWLCYFIIVVVFATHLADVASPNPLLAFWQNRINAINIIMLWIRLMKSARAFSSLGPFIVIVGCMFGDILKFFFLYLVFYIPYTCAFWMIMGGSNPQEVDIGTSRANNTMVVDGFETFTQVMFAMFRLTLVDDYAYSDMKKVDSLMTDILVGTWLAISAIVCLNLFIALMSDTFQRVYDNANANAVMQKAITILNIQDSLLPQNFLRKYQRQIHEECAPESLYYDDDLSTEGDDDMKKVTLQLKDDMEYLKEVLESPQFKPKLNNEEGNSSSTVTVQKFENEVDLIREEIREISVRQNEVEEKLHLDMVMVQSLLQNLLSTLSSGDQQGRDVVDGRFYDRPGPRLPAQHDEHERQRSHQKERKKKKQVADETSETGVRQQTSQPSVEEVGSSLFPQPDPNFESAWSETDDKTPKPL